jgi:hypothetical protein
VQVTLGGKAYFVELLVSKNLQITSFMEGTGSALFKMKISDYIIVGFNSIEKLHVEDTSKALVSLF